MKSLSKGKIATSLVVVATLILAGVAIYTALRLYQLRSQPVALNTPSSEPQASQGNTVACQLLTFTLTDISPTDVPLVSSTLTPTNIATVTLTPNPSNTVSPTSSTITTTTPTPIKPPSIPAPPECVATRPDAPILTSVERSGTTATLKWTKVDLATHYVISYGVSPDNFQYGVPNTGNVTTYTIEQLSAGTKYYFTVYAVNDCMPSEGSKVITSVAGTSTGTGGGSQELPATGVSIPTVFGIGAGILIIAAALILAL